MPPGDDSASLPIGSLQEQLELTTDLQSGMECDQAPPASTVKTACKTVEGDRNEVSVHTNPVDAAPLGDRAVPRPPALAQSSHYQSVLLRDSYQPQAELDGLYALRQAARLKTLRQRTSSRSKVAFAILPNTADYGTLDSYAAPLSPLRERDLTALAALFQRDDIYAIEADVSHRLLSLLPEPCWEDDVFAFLQEFL